MKQRLHFRKVEHVLCYNTRGTRDRQTPDLDTQESLSTPSQVQTRYQSGHLTRATLILLLFLLLDVDCVLHFFKVTALPTEMSRTSSVPRVGNLYLDIVPPAPCPSKLISNCLRLRSEDHLQVHDAKKRPDYQSSNGFSELEAENSLHRVVRNGLPERERCKRILIVCNKHHANKS